MKRTPLKRGTKQMARSGFRKPDINALKVAKRPKSKPSGSLPNWLKAIP